MYRPLEWNEDFLISADHSIYSGGKWDHFVKKKHKKTTFSHSEHYVPNIFLYAMIFEVHSTHF